MQRDVEMRDQQWAQRLQTSDQNAAELERQLEQARNEREHDARTLREAQAALEERSRQVSLQEARARTALTCTPRRRWTSGSPCTTRPSTKSAAMVVARLRRRPACRHCPPPSSRRWGSATLPQACRRRRSGSSTVFPLRPGPCRKCASPPPAAHNQRVPKTLESDQLWQANLARRARREPRTRIQSQQHGRAPGAQPLQQLYRRP